MKLILIITALAFACVDKPEKQTQGQEIKPSAKRVKNYKQGDKKWGIPEGIDAKPIAKP